MTYSARQMDYVSDSVILHRWFHISFVIYIEPMKVMDSTGSSRLGLTQMSLFSSAI